MTGFYGNINNINKSTFQFDKIYTSRDAMEKGCSGDGVFIGRYVLVKYDTPYWSDSNDNPHPDSQSNHSNYRVQGYDGTVWQKVYSTPNVVEYILVAELNSTAPIIKFVSGPPILPTNENNWGLIKAESDAMYYKILAPSAWQFESGNLNFNKNGFNPTTKTKSEDADSIELVLVSSSKQYPTIDGGKATAEDTYKLNINLPSIGNVVSDIWDIIYGAPQEGNNRNTNIFGENVNSLAGAYNKLNTVWENYKKYLTGDDTIPKNFGEKWVGKFQDLENIWENYKKYLTGNSKIPESLDEDSIGEFFKLKNIWEKYKTYLTGDDTIPESFDESWIGKFQDLENRWKKYQKYLTGDDEIPENFDDDTEDDDTESNNPIGVLPQFMVEWDEYKQDLFKSWDNYQKYLTGNLEEDIASKIEDNNWIGKFPKLENEWNDYQGSLTNAFEEIQDEWQTSQEDLEKLKDDLETLRGSVVEGSLESIEDWNLNEIYKCGTVDADGNVSYNYYYKDENTGEAVRITSTLWGLLMALQKELSELDNNYASKISEVDILLEDIRTNIRDYITEAELNIAIDDDWDEEDGKGSNPLSKRFIKENIMNSPTFTGTPTVSIQQISVDENNNPIIVEENKKILTENNVDSVLSNTSLNPVQNQTITQALDEKMDKNISSFEEEITFLQTPKVRYQTDIEYGQQYQDMPVITEKTLGPRLFIAIYNSTTLSELQQAENQNKTIICMEQNEKTATKNFYYLLSSDGNIYKFFRCDSQGYCIVTYNGLAASTEEGNALSSSWNKTIGKWDGSDINASSIFMIDYDEQNLNAGTLIQNAIDSGKFVICRYAGDNNIAANYFVLTYHNAEKQLYTFRCMIDGYYYKINYRGKTDQGEINNAPWELPTYIDNDQTKIKKYYMEPFWAEFGSTSLADIATAYSNGQMVLCKAKDLPDTEPNGIDRIFYLDNINTNQAQFVAIDANRNFSYLTCNSNNSNNWYVSSNRIKLEGDSSAQDIDDELDVNSSNPVQNTVITNAINNITNTKANLDSPHFIGTPTINDSAIVTEDKIGQELTNALNSYKVKSIASSGSPLTVSTNASGAVAISHDTSGVTANPYGPTGNAEPAFSGTFKVPGITVNDTGHVTAATTYTVKIPSYGVVDKDKNTNGLMSVNDKKKLDGITAGATNTTIQATSPINASAKTGTVILSHEKSGPLTTADTSKGDTSNQTPTWGKTFKVTSGTVDKFGHTKTFAEHTVTIPNAVAKTNADGLMSADDKKALDAVRTHKIIDVTKMKNNSMINSGVTLSSPVSHIILYNYDYVNHTVMVELNLKFTVSKTFSANVEGGILATPWSMVGTAGYRAYGMLGTASDVGMCWVAGGHIRNGITLTSGNTYFLNVTYCADCPLATWNKF